MLPLCLSGFSDGRAFVNTFVQFKKPIVVAVNGPAVGLGAALLPLCDVVWANEKAWFQTPYTVYGQTPDACSSFTFPRIMGVASVRHPACSQKPECSNRRHWLCVASGLPLTSLRVVVPLPAGQRDAAQREEAHGAGGVCQGAGVPGALARHLHPGSHAPHQRAGLSQLTRTSTLYLIAQ